MFFLTYSWKFLRSNTVLEQSQVKLKKILGFRKHTGKVIKSLVGELKIGRNHSAASHFAPSSPFFSLFSILFPPLFVLAIIERNTFYHGKNTDHPTMIQNQNIHLKSKTKAKR